MAEAKTGSRVFLLSSLALGVLAMVAAFVFLQNTAGKETGPTKKVLVAKRDLRENTVLDPDKDLREVEVPNRLTELLGLLGLEEKTVAAEVEDIEHHLRPQTLEVLEKLVGFWKKHPEQLQLFRQFAKQKQV